MRDIPKPIPEKPVRFISIIDGKGGKHRITLILLPLHQWLFLIDTKNPAKAGSFSSI
jgi:hypothetical protein